tara:strand:- start:407 stop:1120 length:714 start_codon:yes stop_codon:yes gene_type:complete
VSEAAEAWAWSAPVDSTAKIVLYWLAHTEIRGVSRTGPTAVSDHAGIPLRAAERAFNRLETGNFISRLKRGIYRLSTVTSDGNETVTRGGPDRHERPKVETVTSDGPDRHERGLLARADLNKKKKTKTSQEQLFEQPEWAGTYNAVAWVKKDLTLQQQANVVKLYGTLDLQSLVLEWESWHESRRGKPKSTYVSFTNWCKKAGSFGKTNGASVGRSAIRSGHALSGDARPRSAGIDF